MFFGSSDIEIEMIAGILKDLPEAAMILELSSYDKKHDNKGGESQCFRVDLNTFGFT